MIFENCYISFKVINFPTSEIDENGDINDATITWTYLIPCHCELVSTVQKSKEKNDFEKISGTIYIDNVDFYSKSIKLFDNKKNEIGEFQIKMVEILENVNQIKLEV